MIDAMKVYKDGLTIEFDEVRVIVGFEQHQIIVTKELFLYVARQIIEIDNMKREKAHD